MFITSFEEQNITYRSCSNLRIHLCETIHEALIRECQEELGCDIDIQYLSGVYYHSAVNSHAFIFRCELKNMTENIKIQLSHEHSEYDWFDLASLSEVQKVRVQDCLAFNGKVMSRAF